MTHNLLCAPDLWSDRGDALQASGAPDLEVEACYQVAVSLAQELSARVSELRAVVRLARLRQHQGRPAEGYAMLDKVYRGFNEGFGSVDLRVAGELLEALVAR